MRSKVEHKSSDWPGENYRLFWRVPVDYKEWELDLIRELAVSVVWLHAFRDESLLQE